MANTLLIAKVSALPGTLTASTMYLIPSATAGFLDIYVTDSLGTVANRIVTKSDISSAAGSVNVVYATYAAMTAVTPTSTEIAYVKDASGDTNVAHAGGAMYIWDTSLATPAWSLMEKQDTFWADIMSVPAAVSGLSVVGSFLAFNGSVIPTYLAQEQW